MNGIHDADFLFTVAEVAVALAGFAALVSVIAQRRDPGSLVGLTERHLLLSMVLASLIAAAFALVPYLAHRLGAAAPWRVSCGLLLAAIVVWTVLGVGRLRRIRRSAEEFKPWIPGWRIAFFNFALMGCTMLALAAATLGGFDSATSAVYLFGLSVMLYLSGVLFVFVFLSVLRD